MVRFDLKNTDYENTSIEKILWKRCKLKLIGKTPRQLIIAIAENFIIEQSRSSGMHAHYGKWALRDRHRYFCKRVMEWLGIEPKSKEWIRLEYYFDQHIKKQFPHMYPTYSRKKKREFEAEPIRNIGLYYDTLYRISANLATSDGTISVGSFYENEYSDHHEDIIIDPAFNRKLYFRLGKHSRYRWYPGNKITTLILYKMHENFGHFNGQIGNRNAMYQVKKFLEEKGIPFKVKISIWRMNLSDPEGKEGSWEVYYERGGPGIDERE